MKVNESKFYDTLHSMIRGSLYGSQVTSVNSMLAQGAKLLPNVESLAYLLATVYHETGNTMLPRNEYGKGDGYDYGKHLDMGDGPGKRVAYTGLDHLYYGRGYVQLTWLTNYKNMTKLTGYDLVNNPELALVPDIASKIAIEGMMRGYFTGKSLKDYFPDQHGVHDPLHARRIINGLDCAELIAEYYNKFLAALKT